MKKSIIRRVAYDEHNIVIMYVQHRGRDTLKNSFVVIAV